MEFENPCHLKGRVGRSVIEIHGLWYRHLPLVEIGRKLARGSMKINHVDQLRIKTDIAKSGADVGIIFHVSPVDYLKSHARASWTDYSATPGKSVDIFSLDVPGLGNVRFIKHWSIRHTVHGSVAAEVHTGFAARVACQASDLQNSSKMVEIFKEALVVLSVIFRQAVTLHGWESICSSSIETIWIYPLEPNLAPPMALEPHRDLAFSDEFQSCAQSLVKKYLEASDSIKKVIRTLSASIAPHVKNSDAGSFLAMFSALEDAMSTEKLSTAEKENLRITNAELTRHLTALQVRLDQEKPIHHEIIRDRVGGFIRSIEKGGPSFAVRFEKFASKHPQLRIYMADLWPLVEKSSVPNLKQIRDSLAHGLQNKYHVQILSVARWHFSIIIERLIFIILEESIPEGININSRSLSGDEWYCKKYWTQLQKKVGS